MSSENPFEEIGSKRPSVVRNDPLRNQVERIRDFYNRKEVKRVVHKAEKLFHTFKDVKKDNPFSIAYAVAKTANIFYDFDKVSVPLALKRFNELAEAGQIVMDESISHILLGFLDEEEIDEVIGVSDPNKQFGPSLKSYTLRHDEKDFIIVWYTDGIETSDVICPEGQDLQATKIALAQRVWDHHGNQVEMTWGISREFVFRKKEPLPWRYEGDFGSYLINRWKNAFQKNLRRFIILHGPPGTGKSTLARQLGSEIDAKVLFVPTDTIISANSMKYFSDALAAVLPNVVVIDDIDRIQGDLDKMLALFEETENKVPLLLATTNHLEKLPGAIKRPGRFDEIWEIAPPPEDVRYKVIQYLAGLEKITLTEEQIKQISDISDNLSLSGAHIREILRRMCLGDFQDGIIDFDGRDLTFSKTWRPANYNQEGVSVHVIPESKSTTYDDDFDEYDVDDDDDDDDDDEYFEEDEYFDEKVND